ncbi:MAG: flagellar hook protein FlgE [Nitrospirales bacterium]|nr:flagellar hook protein FlgE [Nitrospira sp.]MDR4502280.1 flagellar hook protein FlgE [Nitrospirales bacterium]
MGITSAFFTATSGINATSRALSEIGNNIANAQTTGYKTRTITFGDLFGASIGGGGTTNALVEGRGVRVLGIDPSFSQGSLQTTSNALDLAVDGDGFFQVVDPNGDNFYTRAGQFGTDASGNITNPAGLKLQGYQADANGVITGTIGDLVLTTTQQVGTVTSVVDMSGNLNAGETATTFDIDDPLTTSSFSTGFQLYDSLGFGHGVTMYFTKTANNAWQYNIVGNASEFTVVAGSTSSDGNSDLIATGSLGFTSGGLLDTESAVTYYNSGTPTGITFTNGAADILSANLTFDFGTSVTTDSGPGTDGMLQQGGSSVILTQSQNGFANGTLAGTSIGEDGTISGRFSNGTTRNLGQVLLTRFSNPDGLQPIGRNLFIQSADSGDPLDGSPGTGGFGKIFANTLEASNVDLGDELVNMITMQRGFQANARIITTTDTLLGELVNLSR